MTLFKKGNVQVSLSWVFMILVGTFFLYVAYNVIDKYSENEETKYYLQVKSALSNVLSKAGTTIGYEENYIQPIDTFFQDSEVEIICNANMPLLSLNGKIDDNVDFLKNIPSFMSTINEGQVAKTYLAVENFKMPFKVTNMMAIVSSKNFIVFDKNSQITKVLREKFSDSSYRDSLSFSEDVIASVSDVDYNQYIKQSNYQSVIFVSDDGVDMGLDLADLDVKAYHLKVGGSSTDFKSGQLSYLDYNGDETFFNYVDFRDDVFNSVPVSMITMAIFSKPDTFDCGHTLIVDSTEKIFEFYINKVKYLIELSKTNQVCSNDLVTTQSGSFDGSFQTAKYESILIRLETGLEEIKNNKFYNHQTLYNIVEEIQRESQDLSDNNCEMIY